MWINSCHVVAFLDAEGEEGFSCTIEREIVSTAQVDGKPVETKTSLKRGPINSIGLAIRYAQSWTDPANPPDLPKPWVDPAKVVAPATQPVVQEVPKAEETPAAVPDAPKAESSTPAEPTK